MFLLCGVSTLADKIQQANSSSDLHNGDRVSFDYNHQNQVEKTTYSDGRTMAYTSDGQVHRDKESGGKAIDYVYTFSAQHQLISSEKQVKKRKGGPDIRPSPNSKYPSVLG